MGVVGRFLRVSALPCRRPWRCLASASSSRPWMSWMLPGAGNGTCFIFKLSFIGYLVGVGFVPIYSFGVFGGFVYVNLVSERMLDLVFAFLDVPRIALFLFHVAEALFFNSFVVFFVYEVECGWG